MRTRFAPSPTGLLHVGGLRTALFSWLVAKQSGGTFILRIEDTDREREVPGALENILQALEWAGLSPDEGVVLEDGVVSQKGGHGPYIQSQRFDIYKEHADMLLKSGHAYHCFCTAQRLEEMRNAQAARHQAPMYDRMCLKLSPDDIQKKIEAGEPHVLRLKVPHHETIEHFDEIRGKVSFQGHTIDDQVLLKSDGFPTYHLANVVDDHHMKIDLVLRGEEWLSSLPKHILLFRAFGWEPPKYAHVSLLLNPDRTKLSKRQGSVSVQEYIDKGYLPEALLNFIALLGWNPGTVQEMFTLEELKQAFSLDRVQSAGAVFDTAKLDWLQGQWMRKLTIEEFVKRIKDQVVEKHPAATNDEHFHKKAALIQERITFFHEAPDMLGYFYEEPTASVELLANAKQKVTPEILPAILELLQNTLSGIDESNWNEEHLLATFRSLTETSGYKLGQMLWPLRAALTGRDYSPGAIEVATMLGKKETLKRIGKAMA